MERRLLSIGWGLGLTAILLAGCDGIQEPDRFSRTDEDFASLAVDNEFTLMRSADVDMASADALFAIGWKGFLGFDTESGFVMGRALAVAVKPELPPAPPFAAFGLNMGSVSVSYSEADVELLERTGRRGGTFYSTFARPGSGDTPTNILFVANDTYEFSVTGSDIFPAYTASITAPSSLIEISSHGMGGVISLSEDLTMEWQGGDDQFNVLLTVVAASRPEPGHPSRGQNLQTLLAEGRAIQYRLDGNPGTYTIPASELEGIIIQSDVALFTIMVSQYNSTVVDRDDGKAVLLAKNSDKIVVSVE